MKPRTVPPAPSAPALNRASTSDAARRLRTRRSAPTPALRLPRYPSLRQRRRRDRIRLRSLSPRPAAAILSPMFAEGQSHRMQTNGSPKHYLVDGATGGTPGPFPSRSTLTVLDGDLQPTGWMYQVRGERGLRDGGGKASPLKFNSRASLNLRPFHRGIYSCSVLLCARIRRVVTN